MVTDPEAIAREVLRLAADRTAAEPQGDFFDYILALRKTAPTLAAAYLDLRATSTEALEAERIRCTRQADRDAARRDAAYLDLRAQLDAVTAQRDGLRAKLAESETWRTELRQEMDAVRGQLRDVTAQRDVVRLALASVFGRGHEERDVVELTADVVRVVAELKGHVAELDGRWKDNASLTAEVERLTAREREVAEWVRAAEFASPLWPGAWGAWCPKCDRSRTQGHAEGCPIAAWLAGCKSDGVTHDGEVPTC